MKYNGQTNYLTIPLKNSISSLYSLIKSGKTVTRTGAQARNAWMSLIPGAPLPANCNQEGLIVGVNSLAKVQLGFVESASSCKKANSFIGIGGQFPGADSVPACGAYVGSTRQQFSAKSIILVR